MLCCLRSFLFEDMACCLLALDVLCPFYRVNSECRCNKLSLILHNPSGQCPPIIISFFFYCKFYPFVCYIHLCAEVLNVSFFFFKFWQGHIISADVLQWVNKYFVSTFCWILPSSAKYCVLYKYGWPMDPVLKEPVL